MQTSMHVLLCPLSLHFGKHSTVSFAYRCAVCLHLGLRSFLGFVILVDVPCRCAQIFVFSSLKGILALHPALCACKPMSVWMRSHLEVQAPRAFLLVTQCESQTVLSR